MINAENINAETDDGKALRFAIRYFERELEGADSSQIEEAARLFLAELEEHR